MSDIQPKPEGMPWLTPYLTCRDTNKIFDFYQKAFGLEEKMVIRNKGGEIEYAELTYKDQVLMMGSENQDEGGQSRSPATLGGASAVINVYCEDVDQAFEQAKSAGATVVKEPYDAFWGDRICVVADPEGHLWTLATRVKEVSPEEMTKAHLEK